MERGGEVCAADVIPDREGIDEMFAEAVAPYPNDNPTGIARLHDRARKRQQPVLPRRPASYGAWT
jgi:hypothetical protein